MTRARRKMMERKEKTKKVIECLVMIVSLFAVISSITFAAFINSENTKIRSIIKNSKEVPNELKKEIGLY